MTDIISKIDEIKRMLEDKLQRLRISANQIEIVHGISDISKRLGLFQSGELRFGNHIEPGKGFTGIRIGFPPFTYSSVEYVLALVSNDTLTFGLSLSGQSSTIESTFVPVIEGSTAAGVGTYSSQSGRYSRIGNTVFISGTLTWSAHTGTGNMDITGLPLTSGNNGITSALAVYWNGITLAAAENKIQAVIPPSSSSIDLYEIGSGTIVHLPLDTAGTLNISGHYFVD